jgi:hypothetical protein
MNKRKFITLLGGAAALPLAARAQQGGRMRRIGVLMPTDENDLVTKTYVSAFTQALADLGWTVGRNVRQAWPLPAERSLPSRTLCGQMSNPLEQPTTSVWHNYAMRALQVERHAWLIISFAQNCPKNPVNIALSPQKSLLINDYECRPSQGSH